MDSKFAAVFLLSLTFLFVACLSFKTTQSEFSLCMSSFKGHLHRRESPKYESLFLGAIQNTCWLNSTTPTPDFILTPRHESDIQTSVLCAREHGFQIQVKSGGHDYEGLSFFSHVLYIILDLSRLQSITINIKEEMAWVQTGATLGELYYSIAKKSLVHAFPGGTCPSVGVGGLISGGGLGMLSRKFGLAVDNVLDARLVDVKGQALDRETMGEDLFWAIRGGGGASFGVITAWKLRLVRVPPVVTLFTVKRHLKESATELVHRWQHIAPKLPVNMLIRLFARRVNNTVRVSFSAQFLGSAEEAIAVMKERFPELGVDDPCDYKEMSWINATISISDRAHAMEGLLHRVDTLRTNQKGKSDFFSKPIPKEAFKGVWERLIREDHDFYLIMDPFGGRNDEISESELPFPHRKGTLYNIQYLINWKVNNATESRKCMKSMRDLYKFMKPFISHTPRAAYLNYRDLDIGQNPQDGRATYREARKWGVKYFKG